MQQKKGVPERNIALQKFNSHVNKGNPIPVPSAQPQYSNIQNQYPQEPQYIQQTQPQHLQNLPMANKAPYQNPFSQNANPNIISEMPKTVIKYESNSTNYSGIGAQHDPQPYRMYPNTNLNPIQPILPSSSNISNISHVSNIAILPNTQMHQFVKTPVENEIEEEEEEHVDINDFLTDSLQDGYEFSNIAQKLQQKVQIYHKSDGKQRNEENEEKETQELSEENHNSRQIESEEPDEAKAGKITVNSNFNVQDLFN